MQFNRIVVGVDFSANSLAAARWVANHFAPDAELVLVHVLPRQHAVSSPRYAQRHLDELRVASPHEHGGLRGLGELLGAGRTKTEILRGDPAEVLAWTAADVGADLICVGSGAHRRGSARFGATTPHRLIARTDVPVLVTPRAPDGVPTRILAPFDNRESTRTVLQTAARLAAAYEAELDALYVIETDSELPASRASEEENHESFAHAQRWAATAVEDLPLPSGRAATFVQPGDAGEQTVSHARRSGSSLVVMGIGERASALRGDKHPRHVGSTTRFVIWAAPCPVLAVPSGAFTTTGRVRPARFTVEHTIEVPGSVLAREPANAT